jgi:Uma2 family endonuclease
MPSTPTTLVFNPGSATMRARLQAWCLAMLSIQCDAYTLGVALGAGAVFQGRGQTPLTPAVLVVPEGHASALEADRVSAAPVLAIDLLDDATGLAVAKGLVEHYAEAGALEYWQIRIEALDRPSFFQRKGTGGFDQVKPDRKGTYYSLFGESLTFPARWFSEQPSLWVMMRHWAIIDDD